MKHLILLNLLLIVVLSGCLGNLQTGLRPTETNSSSTEGEPPNTLAALELSTPKATYSAKDTIPIELQIQNGKFDLLVPYSSVAMQRAFRQITVTDGNGVVVKSRKMMPLGNTLKTLYKDGKSVRCVQGFDMKAGTIQTVLLENLLEYYKLVSGNYTVNVTLELEVYNEFMQDQHPQIIELEREIYGIQKSTNPQFTPEVKKEAIGYTQDQIKLIQEKYKDELQDIYLPTKSRRGKALLESNTITISIE